MAVESIHLELDTALVERAQRAGALSKVVNEALRRWAEENALLVEALAGGASEAALR